MNPCAGSAPGARLLTAGPDFPASLILLVFAAETLITDTGIAQPGEIPLRVALENDPGAGAEDVSLSPEFGQANR